MASSGGMLAPAAMRALQRAVGSTAKMTKILRTKLAVATRTVNAELQPIVVRSSGRQPIHPAAFLRQSKRGVRWNSTSAFRNINSAVRRYLSTGGAGQSGPRFDRSKFPTSSISRAVSHLPGRTPFASTLRPNLTGGALPRTAGGYAMPGSGRVGGQRYFSHTPAAPAQVVQNVSQAMRAFWLSGQRAHYDGCGPNGEKRYRAVSALQDEAGKRLAGMPQRTPGAYVDFRISPTVTALSPLAAAFPFPSSAGHVAKAEASTLNEEGFLDVLSVDFARALKDLAAVMNDLKRLSVLGDLPVQLEKNNILRVRFPGVDADTVDRLCDDIGVQRGIVGEDPDFDDSVGVPMALRFPYAPGATGAEDAITSPGGSMRSHRSELSSEEDAFFEEFLDENPWLSTPSPELDEEGYESMSPPILSSGEHCSEDFEGVEGIYRFLEECDRARGKYSAA